MAHNIMVIVGSTRPTRNGKAIADWFMEQAEHDDLNFNLVDLQDLNLPILNEPASAMTGNYEHDYTKKWSEQVTQADGFVLVTPEYNHGPPASLKNALDYLYSEWSRKPFAFVGYGGAGGARSIMQIEQIVAEFDAAPLRGAINVLNPWSSVKDGKLVDESAVHGSVEEFVNRLAWWTKALAEARD